VLRMWLFPLLTLGAASVFLFCAGAIPAMVAFADYGLSADGLWASLLFMLLGLAGMWGTVRLTPERG